MYNWKNGFPVKGAGKGGGTGGSAGQSQVLAPFTFTNDSGQFTGTMPNNGIQNFTPGTSPQSIPLGYTGGGTVAGSVALVPGNIVQGATIFGVPGNVVPYSNPTGSATPAQVLAPNTFMSAGSASQQTGTMPNNGAVNRTPSGVAQSIPAGYTTGGTVAAIAGLDATKILEGWTIGGTNGTAATVVYLSAPTQKKNSSASVVAIKEIMVFAGGTMEVSFTFHPNATGTQTAQIFKNGTAFGTLRTQTGGAVTTYTENLAATAGDTFELRVKCQSGFPNSFSAFLIRSTAPSPTNGSVNVD